MRKKKVREIKSYSYITFKQHYLSEFKSWYTTENSVYKVLVKSQPMNVYLPRPYDLMAERIWNFNLKSDDIFIVTYPKCGTTLTQEIIWQMANDCPLNNEMSKIPILARAPWIEASCILNPVGMDEALKPPPNSPFGKMFHDSIKFVDTFPSPRIIKTHLPIAMIPPNTLDTAKIIYVAR